VNDEQDAPWQIVLGSLNPVYCILCSRILRPELNLKLNATSMNSQFFALAATAMFQIED
jgi:hypothetical protein